MDLIIYASTMLTYGLIAILTCSTTAEAMGHLWIHEICKTFYFQRNIRSEGTETILSVKIISPFDEIVFLEATAIFMLITYSIVVPYQKDSIRKWYFALDDILPVKQYKVENLKAPPVWTI